MERGQGTGTMFAPHHLGDVFFPTDDIIPETLQPGVEDQVLDVMPKLHNVAIDKRRNNQQFRCLTSKGGPRSSPGTLTCLNHGTT